MDFPDPAGALTTTTGVADSLEEAQQCPASLDLADHGRGGLGLRIGHGLSLGMRAVSARPASDGHRGGDLHLTGGAASPHERGMLDAMTDSATRAGSLWRTVTLRLGLEAANTSNGSSP